MAFPNLCIGIQKSHSPPTKPLYLSSSSRNLLHQCTTEQWHVRGLCDLAGLANRRFVTAIPELCRVPRLIEHVVRCVMLRLRAPPPPRPSRNESILRKRTCRVRNVCGAVPAKMDLDHPEEHKEKVARHRAFILILGTPSFMKAVYAWLQEPLVEEKEENEFGIE